VALAKTWKLLHHHQKDLRAKWGQQHLAQGLKQAEQCQHLQQRQASKGK
jgi:hypothetical protein